MATWRLPAIRRLYGVDSLRSVLLPQQQASAVALAVGVTMSTMARRCNNAVGQGNCDSQWDLIK